MTTHARARRLPPPAWMVLGLLAQRRLAAGSRPTRASRVLAGGVAGASLGLAGWAVGSFRRHDTTVDPLAPERASHLVADGAFQTTRNPMYVGMAGVLLAHAVARRSVAGLVPLAGFVLVISRTQIAAEERAMAANFGPDWEAYAATTPRWVGLRSLGSA
ncbi:isoprenylcysteine carboxylmethyltransferase family protein [Nocardioides sp.]|uniref:methyltransferase family protein n=1 Tax=Nocardioides sp. TaxID=35761 RepID=UPI0025EDDC7E|nr:isoprenylcysteine carboxylmethyltransferase family protein [Nocardioides sp.]